MSRGGQGRNIKWLRAHVNYDGEGCLIWPFCRIPNGYGTLGYLGKIHYAHRFMCELVNGPPPTPKHEAAHSCGKGHEGCYHPKHLSWKTKAANVQDSWDHTPKHRNPNGSRGRLTYAEVDAIRALKGVKTQAVIAAQFNISQPTVRDIFLGRSHRPNPKLRAFRPNEDAELIGHLTEGLRAKQIAEKMGRSEKCIRGRMERLGLTRKQFQSDGQYAGE